MATIYLSSTYEDLKDYRLTVFEALRKSGYHVIAMEDYVATDQRPADKCLQDVEKADIYIGLFAFRYGYVPPAQHNNPQALSITELEFRHAEARKKPLLTFIAKDNAGIPLKFVDHYSGEGAQGKHIDTLRKYLLAEKLASPFASPHELATLVLAAIAKHLQERMQSESAISCALATPPAVVWDIEKSGSPYPGLLHFTRKYAPVFFGRDREIRAILDCMRTPQGRFILISGESGVGKSSVVDAGILPRLEQGGLPGGETCECVRMVPGQGQQPWHALVAALGSLATRAGLRPDAIIDDLAQNPETLPGYFKRIVKDGSERQTLVLFLDQMEELFTAQDQAKADQFLSVLYRAAQEKTVWVLATVRSDHLQYCHRHAEMVKVLRGDGYYPVGPIESFMLADMIVKPAHCAGLHITDDLARLIVEDAATKERNLPLLGFVLAKLYERRIDRELSEKVYRGLGGVVGAIGEHVKTVESKIEATVKKKAEQILPDIFQTLVRVQQEEGIPTRNRPLLTDFTGERRKVVDLLVAERLLRTEGEKEQATVSLSHERLFDAWPTLKNYVEKNKKDLIDRTLLESRAKRWVDKGRPWFEGLASRRECRDFRRTDVTPTSQLKEYLHASSRARLIEGVVILTFILTLSGISFWLLKADLTLEDAFLTTQVKFMSIHIEPEMQSVEAGKYRQGGAYERNDPSERPVREVQMKKFSIGKYEVTFDEYKRFAIANRLPLPHDETWGRGRRPVINVSWDDAKAYAKWLSQATGKRYRLPTESEWEYAARSEGKDEIWAGTSNEEELKNYAVYVARRTEPVGEPRKPNGLSLYDMSGNVREWVEDCWHKDYTEAPTDGSAWLEANGGECGERVIRGGSWGGEPGDLRVSNRDFGIFAALRGSLIGFRLAQDIEP